MGVVVAVVATVVAIGCYLTWIAGRLDRLAIRVESARASLDAQLVRRAAAAQLLATKTAGPPGDPQEHLQALASAATTALEASTDGREAAESGLTRALSTALAQTDGELREDAESAATRVQLARQFHNDAVHACRALRRRRLVRWLRLYGHARPPAYFEIDDALR